MRKWIYDHFILILVVGGVIGLVSGVIYLYIAKQAPEDLSTKEEIYENKRLVEQDFNNITKIKGGKIETLESSVKVTLKKGDYELIVNYDESGEIVSQKLVNNDLGHMNFLGDMGFVIISAFGFATIAALLWMAIAKKP